MPIETTDEAGIARVIQFIEKEIKTTKRPFVPWGELLREADNILRGFARPRLRIWSIMEPFVYSISEDNPKSKNPKLYEYKLGAVYYYYPVEMIETCFEPAKE